MKIHRRKIILWLLFLFLISRPYFFYRHFYIVQGVPITLWDKKIIIGEWYWKFSEPTRNYLEVPVFDEIEIYFLDKKHFAVGISEGDSAQIIHNLEGYTCVECTKRCSGYYEKYPLENSLVAYNFIWDWGRFFPRIRYPKNNKIYELDGYRVGYWVFSKRDPSFYDHMRFLT